MVEGGQHGGQATRRMPTVDDWQVRVRPPAALGDPADLTGPARPRCTVVVSITTGRDTWLDDAAAPRTGPAPAGCSRQERWEGTRVPRHAASAPAQPAGRRRRGRGGGDGGRSGLAPRPPRFDGRRRPVPGRTRSRRLARRLADLPPRRCRTAVPATVLAEQARRAPRMARPRRLRTPLARDAVRRSRAAPAGPRRTAPRRPGGCGAHRRGTGPRRAGPQAVRRHGCRGAPRRPRPRPHGPGGIAARRAVVTAGADPGGLLDGAVDLPPLRVTQEQPAHFPFHHVPPCVARARRHPADPRQRCLHRHARRRVRAATPRPAGDRRGLRRPRLQARSRGRRDARRPGHRPSTGDGHRLTEPTRCAGPGRGSRRAVGGAPPISTSTLLEGASRAGWPAPRVHSRVDDRTLVDTAVSRRRGRWGAAPCPARPGGGGGTCDAASGRGGGCATAPRSCRAS